MAHDDDRPAPISAPQIAPLRRAACRAAQAAAWGAGYSVGLLRYQLLPELSLFSLLDALGRGVDAATPEGERSPRVP